MRKGIIIGMLFLLLLTGCGSAAMESNPTTGPAETTGSGTEGTGSAAPPPEETKTTSMITAYYSNSDLTELISSEVTITYKDDIQKFQETFKQLIETPKAELEPLWYGVELKEIRLENGTLQIDVSFGPESNLGSGGELFALEALQKTFFQYDEVQRIQILVDGQIAESLMGHVEINKPFERP